MTAIRVGIVTVTFNGANVLDDFLASMEGLVGISTRLYAVDNASIDSTLELLSNYSERCPLVLIRNIDNAGVAVGNNQGIEAALADGCDWVLLLNNDTVFSARFVADLVAVAEGNNLDILSPLIEATEPTATTWYSDGVIQPFKAMKATHLGMGNPISHQLPVVRTVDYASTCALLVRPSVFARVGLMDPVYFVYGDDVDFCIRAKRGGFNYSVAGQVILRHKASSMTGEFTGPFAVRWISRNWVVVARRHCTPIQLVIGSLYMIAWTGARALLRRESLAVTVSRVKAFVEGWQVSLKAPAPLLSMIHSDLNLRKVEGNV